MFKVLGLAPVWKKRLKSVEEFSRYATEHRLPAPKAFGASLCGTRASLSTRFRLKTGAESIIGVPPVSEYQAG